MSDDKVSEKASSNSLKVRVPADPAANREDAVEEHLSIVSEAQLAELARRAAEARQWAYAPYSNYAVGAALLTASGKVYDGVNVENAAYPDTICAERTTVVKAVSEGEREFIAIAVSTANGGMPCGSCRQVLAEFGLETVVVIADAEGTPLKRTTLRELLPESFGPAQLR